MWHLPEKSKLWKAFIHKINSDTTGDFFKVIEKIKTFIEPVVSGEYSIKTWQPGLWKWNG